jgi:hypothetical protein
VILTSPGIYSWYPSSMVGPWWTWFVDLGYPELDIARYEDGSWDIIRYLNSPVMPCLTRHQLVLGHMFNVDITHGFVEKHVQQLDTSRKEFWDREEAKTKAVEDEARKVELHAEEFSSRGTAAIMQNPDLMERVMKNGLQEIDIDRIGRHVPKHNFRR